MRGLIGPPCQTIISSSFTGRTVRWDAQSDQFPPCQTIIPTAFRSQSGLPDHPLRNDIAASTSTPLCGTSLIFFSRHTQDTFESLAKRRVRVVADRLCYLEELPITFPQQAGRLVHSPLRQIFEGRFPKQFFKSQCKG